MLLALEVAANAIQEAGLSTREDGGLKRQLAPSSTAGSRGQGPTSRSKRGLAPYALAAASPSSTQRQADIDRRLANLAKAPRCAVPELTTRISIFHDREN
jgi:hypothetical protein